MVPNKVIPCFGVHPWYAHKHGMRESTCVRNVVEAKSEDELSKLGELLNDELPISWQPKLLQLLLEYPESIVGEFGLDRAAVIPGSKANVSHHNLPAAVIKQCISCCTFQHLQQVMSRIH